MSRNQKTIQYLYERAVNVSGRKKSYPKDNEDITKPYSLDTINIGVKSLENQLFIRVSFRGASNKYYELGIQYDRIDYWFNFVKSLYVDSPELDFLLDSEEEEEEYDEFARNY